MVWIIMSLLLLFVFTMLLKNEKSLEHIRKYSLRFVIGVLLLYIVHIAIGRYGINISINFFSISMVVLLGLPGMLTIILISFLN